MKNWKSILSFIITLARIVFQPEHRRKPPCCPCPYAEKEPPEPEKTEEEE